MPDTSEMRTLARRVKQKALTRALAILEGTEKVSDEIYNETYLTVLKNAVPRTQELTGEDGQALKIEVINYANNPNTISVGTGTAPATSITTTSEIQSDSVAPQGSQDDTGDKRADTPGSPS